MSVLDLSYHLSAATEGGDFYKANEPIQVLKGFVSSGLYPCASHGWYLIKLAENLSIKKK